MARTDTGSNPTVTGGASGPSVSVVSASAAPVPAFALSSVRNSAAAGVNVWFAAAAWVTVWVTVWATVFANSPVAAVVVTDREADVRLVCRGCTATNAAAPSRMPSRRATETMRANAHRLRHNSATANKSTFTNTYHGRLNHALAVSTQVTTVAERPRMRAYAFRLAMFVSM